MTSDSTNIAEDRLGVAGIYEGLHAVEHAERQAAVGAAVVRHQRTLRQQMTLC
jgi:hypothetical protein